MKDFFEDASCFASVLFGIAFLSFVVILCIDGNIRNQRNYQNYQRALTTVIACRLAAKETADFTCGQPPNVKKFDK